MASTRKAKNAALLVAEAVDQVVKRKDGLQARQESIDEETTKYTHQPTNSNSLKIKLDHLKTIKPLTENQQKFFDCYNRGDYFIGLLGSAGTGKTYISLYKALEEVLDKTNPFKQVIVVRSCVPTRDVGFLPGSLEEKQEIYELPYKEACSNLFDRKDAWDRLKEQGYARFLTTTAIRGISLDESIIIVDEAANLTWHELATIMTRVGYKSKIIIVGDYVQSDLIKHRNDVSGLVDFIKVAKTMGAFSLIEFTSDDIVRSSLVKDWIIACESFGII